MCYRTRRTREDRGLLRVGALKKGKEKYRLYKTI